MHFPVLQKKRKKQNKTPKRWSLRGFVDFRFRSRHHPLAATRLHPDSGPFLSSPLPGAAAVSETGQCPHSPRRGGRGRRPARTGSPEATSPRVQVPGAPRPSLLRPPRAKAESAPRGSRRGRPESTRAESSLPPLPRPAPQGVPLPGDGRGK